MLQHLRIGIVSEEQTADDYFILLLFHGRDFIRTTLVERMKGDFSQLFVKFNFFGAYDTAQAGNESDFVIWRWKFNGVQLKRLSG